MNGLLKTLMKPDWDDNPKRSEIIQAANLIQIGEFQLIQLAYKNWYKEDLPEDKINHIFNEYMRTEFLSFISRQGSLRVFEILSLFKTIN